MASLAIARFGSIAGTTVISATFLNLKESRMKKLGIPINAFGPGPLTEEKSGHPAFGWELSDEARRAIKAIDDNRRMAMHRIARIVLD